jgi:hypothetical protein
VKTSVILSFLKSVIALEIILSLISFFAIWIIDLYCCCICR